MNLSTRLTALACVLFSNRRGHRVAGGEPLSRRRRRDLDRHHRGAGDRLDEVVSGVEPGAGAARLRAGAGQSDAEAEIAERQRTMEELRESEARFRQVTENMREIFFLVDPWNTRTFYVSSAYEEIWGRSCESLYASPLSWADSIHADDRERVFREIAPHGEVGQFDAEYRIVRPDATVRRIHARGFPIRNGAGEVHRIAGVAEDVTERSRAAEIVGRQALALEESHRRMALLGDMTGLLQTAVDLEEAGKIVSQHLAHVRLGRGGAVYVYKESRNYLDAIARWGDASPVEGFQPEDCWALRRGQRYGSDEVAALVCAHVARSGSETPYLCLPMVSQGGILGLVHLVLADEDAKLPESECAFARRLSQQLALALANLKLREALREQSFRDPLTRLHNRRHLEESLVREFARATRENGRVAVAMIDADHFKRFNDAHGHDAGAAALRQLGRALKETCRASDLACRFGGEEFTVVLPGATAGGARQWADRLLERVRGMEISLHGTVLPRLTVSIGIAFCPEHGEDPETVLQAADLALYDAKHAGRDRVTLKGEAVAPIATES